MEQRTQDWKKAVAGSVGGSSAHKATAKIKSGSYSADRKNLLAEKFIERLTGELTEIPTTSAMQWGVDNEPGARKRHEFENLIDVDEVGVIKHPTILWAHYSPDGLIGDDGLLEIKCPNTATHLLTLENEIIDAKYITQMQWGLCVTGRSWCDYVSYDPRLPHKASYFQKRIYRDEAFISNLENEIISFIAELDDMVVRFIDKYGPVNEERLAA